MKGILFILFLVGSLSAQKMYCTEDSVPVYAEKSVYSKVLCRLYKDTPVKSFKNTEEFDYIDHGKGELHETFYWCEVTTKDNIKGWTLSHPFVPHLYKMPEQKLQINGLPKGYDEVYPIGWSKDGLYYAYLAVGYIDGATDGLTVRGYIINTKTNYTEYQIISFTGYDTPIKDAWEHRYSWIQQWLTYYKIIPVKNPGKLNSTPVTTSKGLELPLNFEINDTATFVYVKYGSETQLTTFYGYHETVDVLGWIPCPYNRNIFIVFTSSNTGSSSNYLLAFAIDVRMLMR